MADDQFGMDFGEAPHDPEKPLFDSDEIREDCLAMLAEARANVDNLVWDAGKLKYNRILFPHVASWSPTRKNARSYALPLRRNVNG